MDTKEMYSEIIGRLDRMKREAQERLNELPADNGQSYERERVALSSRVEALRDAMDDVGEMRWRFLR